MRPISNLKEGSFSKRESLYVELTILKIISLFKLSTLRIPTTGEVLREPQKKNLPTSKSETDPLAEYLFTIPLG